VGNIFTKDSSILAQVLFFLSFQMAQKAVGEN